MSLAEILGLLLAMSVALNVASGAYLIARAAGVGSAQAVLTGAGAAASFLGLFLAGVAAYG